MSAAFSEWRRNPKKRPGLLFLKQNYQTNTKHTMFTRYLREFGLFLVRKFSAASNELIPLDSESLWLWPLPVGVLQRGVDGGPELDQPEPGLVRLAALLSLSPRLPDVLTTELTTEGGHDGGKLDIPPSLLALMKSYTMMCEKNLIYLCTVRLN